MAQEPLDLDDPVKKRRVVRALLFLSPALFVFCYILAWSQGAAPRHTQLIAAIGMCLAMGAAAAIHLLGSRAWMAAAALKIALLFVSRR